MQANSLADKNCEPCKGNTAPMDEATAQEMLAELGEKWELRDGATKLYRAFKFKNFKRAIAYTNALGDVAEEEGHHPDIELGWGYVRITVQTHSINGLTESDFILSAKAEKIFQDMKKAV